MQIKVNKTTKSRISELDFNNIPFGRVFTDHMFFAQYADGEWKSMEIKPLDNLSVHPANMAWHYGQSIFEGMKAFKNKDGKAVLFRPQDHAKRFNRSAARMAMPDFDEKTFVDALKKLVDLDKDWIPTSDGASLYIRPFMYATDEFLGVAPSKTYNFIILLLPVGPYYSKPVSLWANPDFVRAVTGGTGEAKAAGNYAGSLLPSKLATEKGFDQILWLDAISRNKIQEVGTMNIFFVFKDEIVTPALDGAILRGITRDSFLKILKAKGHNVVERELSILEVIERDKKGELLEVFGAGTAAVATRVHKIVYKDEEVHLDLEKSDIANQLKSIIHDIRIGNSEDTFGWIQFV